MCISCSPSRGNQAHLPASGSEYKGSYKNSYKGSYKASVKDSYGKISDFRGVRIKVLPTSGTLRPEYLPILCLWGSFKSETLNPKP